MRCVIVGAAPIRNYKKISSFLHDDDFYIICDGGLNHVKKLKIKPGLITGDFDSHKNPNLPVETIVLPREKDDTDSVFALKTAIARGFTDFLFLGMTGERFDHSLANLSLLLRCKEYKCSALMIDDFSEMELVGTEETFIEDKYSFFSLINITGCARGISIKGAKYPLDNAEITSYYQYGVSNEVLPGQRAAVSVKEGCLLLVKIW